MRMATLGESGGAAGQNAVSLGAKIVNNQQLRASITMLAQMSGDASIVDAASNVTEFLDALQSVYAEVAPPADGAALADNENTVTATLPPAVADPPSTPAIPAAPATPAAEAEPLVSPKPAPLVPPESVADGAKDDASELVAPAPGTPALPNFAPGLLFDDVGEPIRVLNKIVEEDVPANAGGATAVDDAESPANADLAGPLADPGSLELRAAVAGSGPAAEQNAASHTREEAHALVTPTVTVESPPKPSRALPPPRTSASLPKPRMQVPTAAQSKQAQALAPMPVPASPRGHMRPPQLLPGSRSSSGDDPQFSPMASPAMSRASVDTLVSSPLPIDPFDDW